MRLTKKQLEKLQEINNILIDSNLTLKLVSFDETLFMLSFHRINSLDSRTYNISSIQLLKLDNEQYIKHYMSVSECLSNLSIFKDLFIYKNLGRL